MTDVESLIVLRRKVEAKVTTVLNELQDADSTVRLMWCERRAMNLQLYYQEYHRLHNQIMTSISVDRFDEQDEDYFRFDDIHTEACVLVKELLLTFPSDHCQHRAPYCIASKLLHSSDQPIRKTEQPVPIPNEKAQSQQTSYLPEIVVKPITNQATEVMSSEKPTRSCTVNPFPDAGYPPSKFVKTTPNSQCTSTEAQRVGDSSEVAKLIPISTPTPTCATNYEDAAIIHAKTTLIPRGDPPWTIEGEVPTEIEKVPPGSAEVDTEDSRCSENSTNDNPEAVPHPTSTTSTQSRSVVVMSTGIHPVVKPSLVTTEILPVVNPSLTSAKNHSVDKPSSMYAGSHPVAEACSSFTESRSVTKFSILIGTCLVTETSRMSTGDQPVVKPCSTFNESRSEINFLVPIGIRPVEQIPTMSAGIQPVVKPVLMPAEIQPVDPPIVMFTSSCQVVQPSTLFAGSKPVSKPSSKFAETRSMNKPSSTSAGVHPVVDPPSMSIGTLPVVQPALLYAGTCPLSKTFLSPVSAGNRPVVIPFLKLDGSRPVDKPYRIVGTCPAVMPTQKSTGTLSVVKPFPSSARTLPVAIPNSTRTRPVMKMPSMCSEIHSLGMPFLTPPAIRPIVKPILLPIGIRLVVKIASMSAGTNPAILRLPTSPRIRPEFQPILKPANLCSSINLFPMLNPLHHPVEDPLDKTDSAVPAPKMKASESSEIIPLPKPEEPPPEDFSLVHPSRKLRHVRVNPMKMSQVRVISPQSSMRAFSHTRDLTYLFVFHQLTHDM